MRQARNEIIAIITAINGFRLINAAMIGMDMTMAVVRVIRWLHVVLARNNCCNSAIIIVRIPAVFVATL